MPYVPTSGSRSVAVRADGALPLRPHHGWVRSGGGATSESVLGCSLKRNSHGSVAPRAAQRATVDTNTGSIRGDHCCPCREAERQFTTSFPCTMPAQQ